MKHPLTEQDIRLLLKKDETVRSLSIPKGTLVTPSAQEFLNMNSIALEFTEGCEGAANDRSVSFSAEGFIGPGGEKLDSKPEELTHLYGNQLTEKDNPVIAFRGKLDKLCAMILEAQLLGEEKENRAFVNDLQEILAFIRSLLPAEYKCILLGEFKLLGMSSRELREKSHYPEKYFGRKHLLMHHSMGALSLRLNLLRTVAREAELAAVATLRAPSLCHPETCKSTEPGRCCRQDIVEALNRLSSLFYILVYKYLPKNYSESGTAGI